MRSFFTAMALAISVVSLPGCAPSTAQGVRQETSPGRATSFVAPEGYQAVYRKVITNARNCYQTGAITAQQVVQGDIYSDIRSGSVTVAMHGGLGVDTYQVYDIAALDDRRTKVTGYFSVGPADQYGRQLWGWVMQGTSECIPIMQW